MPTQASWQKICIFLPFPNTPNRYSQYTLWRVTTGTKKNDNILGGLTIVPVLVSRCSHSVFTYLCEAGKFLASHTRGKRHCFVSSRLFFIFYFEYRLFCCGGLNLSCDALLQRSLRSMYGKCSYRPQWPKGSTTHRNNQQLAGGPCWFHHPD